jgi:hypothetical protein
LGVIYMSDVDSEATRRHLEKVLISDQLAKSDASRKLLTYLVERSLRNDTPKEMEIAVDVFGRGASFNGAEDSVVRVAVRTLRQKLAEYYAASGRDDGIQFVIPKGAYRLTVTPLQSQARPLGAPEKPPGIATDSPLRWAFAVVVLCLALSLIGNYLLWHPDAPSPADPTRARVRSSPVWADVVASHRPLTIVLGDLFMFTQVDGKTGRTLTVRDTQINSSEELRAFLASNPSFAAERGQRYVSMVQKSAAIGMASILQIVDRPGRRIEVTLRDELTNSQILNNDIIYVGPMSGLGPLFGFYEARSRYRYNAADSTLTDVDSHKSFSPQGVLSAERLDYALAAKFVGPNGNYIMVFTSGVRNAGLLQVVRTLTSPDGLDRLQRNLRAKPGALPDSFEALLTVAGFRQTDLAADIVDVNPLPVRLDAGRLGQRR